MSKNAESLIHITLETGLHARPAGILAKTAGRFSCQIELEKNGVKKNAKSILSLLSLGVSFGDQIKCLASGEDAEAAVAEVTLLFQNNFQGPT